MRLAVLSLSVLIACGGAQPAPTAAPPRVLVNVDADGVGLGGNDPLGYVLDQAAVAGDAAQASAFGGATYHFASAEHKATFDADRARYAPQFGGYCAFAASQNRLSPSDPEVFVIHGGQLLMFTNQDFLDQFNKDPAGNKQKADANWPGLVAKHGKPAS